MSPDPNAAFGQLLSKWRQLRHLSQLNLASDAGISQRHLSFVESGRSVPSRDMVLRLAEHLRIPMRERNGLLVAAGYAPSYGVSAIDAPELASVRAAVQAILDGHRPHPALAIDRHWTLLMANAPALGLLDGVADALKQPPINVLRISLHPNGLAPRILNFREWRAHIVSRLMQQIDLSGDQTLVALLEEIKAYPVPPGAPPHHAKASATPAIAVPLQLASPSGPLSFLSTTTIFGTALDILVSELTIESFFPADESTAKAMRAIGGE